MELFRLLGRICVDNTEANDAMDDTVDKGKNTQSKLSTAFDKMGSVAVKAGKVIASGIAVGATAIGALATKALSSYADYEQLVGGVETLYGTEIQTLEEYAESVGKVASEVTHEYEMMMNRQDAVMENAKKAYKTAGLSVNEYMETVNGFAASLTSSLGEYQWQAAGYADMIVTDMADNANKMGTSMESIQNAYSGFSKQNYTMLDNLKLGYGGTKEEMQRLLRDAEEFGGYVEGSLSIESFADVAEAINLIQTKLGITGTTAKEASATISGSVATMKAAWSNLLIAFGDEQADLSSMIDEFIGSIVTVAQNIVPRLEIILNGIAQAVTQIVPKIAEILPSLIESLLPALIQGAVSLTVGLITALPSILAIFIEQIPFIVSQISQALVVAFPVLLQTVYDLFGQIWDYIAVGLLGTSADFDSTMQNITTFFQNAWIFLQELWFAIGQPVFSMIQNILGTVHGAFAAKMPEIQAFVSKCFSDIGVFWNNNLKPCLVAIGDFIENILAPVFESVFEGFITPIIDTAFQYISSLWEDTLKPVFTGITDFLTGVFTGNWEQAWEGIKSILSGILNGIITGIEGMINGAISCVNGLIEGINSLIGKAGELIGLDVAIPTIPSVNLPKLYKGGVLERGQVGLLEGSGAEAVVPLENNSKWISAVANDMQAQGIGGGAETLAVLREILALLKELKDEGAEMLLYAIAGGLKLDINNREFARLVKAVN